MNSVELFTRSLTIMVHLDGHNDEDFDVTIEDGSNKTKAIRVRKQYMIDKDTYKIEYLGLNLFPIDNLKITCKYPVVVRYNDVVFSKYIEPVTTK